MSFNCDRVDRSPVFLLPEQVGPVLRDRLPPALDRAVRVAHVSFRRKQQPDSLRVHLAPQRPEALSEQPDIALLAGRAPVRIHALGRRGRGPRRRRRRRRVRSPASRREAARSGSPRYRSAPPRRASRRAPGPFSRVASVGSPSTPDFETTPGASFLSRQGAGPARVLATARFMSTADGSTNSIIDVATSSACARRIGACRSCARTRLQPVARIGIAQKDPGVGERLRGVGQRHQRRRLGVQDVEAPGPVFRQTADDIHRHRLRRPARERRGPGILDEVGMEGIRQRRRDHHGGRRPARATRGSAPGARRCSISDADPARARPIPAESRRPTRPSGRARRPTHDKSASETPPDGRGACAPISPAVKTPPRRPERSFAACRSSRLVPPTLSRAASPARRSRSLPLARERQ